MTNKNKFDDLTDTKENRRNRQRKRREALNQEAQKIGYETWNKLETAVLHGKVVLTVGHKVNLQPNKDYFESSQDESQGD